MLQQTIVIDLMKYSKVQCSENIKEDNVHIVIYCRLKLQKKMLWLYFAKWDWFQYVLRPQWDQILIFNLCLSVINVSSLNQPQGTHILVQTL